MNRIVLLVVAGALLGVLALLLLVPGEAVAPSVLPPADLRGEPSDTLTIQFIGNAGVELSDGVTTLLTDLPYESGAYGYMQYDPEALQPKGQAVAVITHRHADHFSPDLFRTRDWSIVGPEEVTALLPAERVISLRDTVDVGAFRLVPMRTPHSDTEHYSYMITWRGVRLFVVGDTEDPSQLLATPDLDIVFITPWLSCIAEEQGAPLDAARLVLYHQSPDGSDRVCGPVEALAQGARVLLAAVHP